MGIRTFKMVVLEYTKMKMEGNNAKEIFWFINNLFGGGISSISYCKNQKGK